LPNENRLEAVVGALNRLEAVVGALKENAVAVN